MVTPRLAAIAVLMTVLAACSETQLPLEPGGLQLDELPAPPAGVRLGVGKTATGYLTGTADYDWSLVASSSSPLNVVPKDGSQTLTFQLNSTRTSKGAGIGYGVKGEICIENYGPDATVNLRVVDYLEYWNDPANEWGVWIETPVDISSMPVIPAYTRTCYPYDIKSPTKPDSPIGFYRNRVRAYVDHFYVDYDPEWAQAPATFTFPEAPTTGRDLTATLAQVVTCPIGYRCEPRLQISRLNGSTVQQMLVNVTHASTTCPADQRMFSGALLREDNSGSLRSSYAYTTVRCT